MSSRGDEIVRVILKIYDADRKYVESIYKTLSPDNRVAPEYMVIRDMYDDNMYRVVFETPLNSRYIDSVKQSIDEILALIQTIEKTIKNK